MTFAGVAIAILVGLLMMTFVGLAALAVDIGHLYLVTAVSKLLCVHVAQKRIIVNE